MKKISLLIFFIFLNQPLFAQVNLEVKNNSLPEQKPKIELKLDQEKITKKENIANESLKTEQFDFKKTLIEAEQYFKLSRDWKVLKCIPKTAFICTKKECLTREVENTLILDKSKNKVSVCLVGDIDKCNDYPADFSQTGVFFNIQTEGSAGVLVRVLGNSRYKAISTIGLDAYISNGECTEFNKK